MWVKREDCSGLAFGGSKVRKLDYQLGTAVDDGIEVVVTSGALQSNHARQTAAACARLGLECHLILYLAVDREDQLYVEGGNRLLDDLLGATVHPIPLGPDTFTQADAVVEAVTAGRPSLVLPAGGSDTLGSLGYVAATVEWYEQGRQAGVTFDRVVMAVSTGGTYAGTLTGFKRTGSRATALGVCVHADVESTRAPIPALLASTAEELGLGRVADDQIELTDEFLGEGYGIPTKEMVEAIALFARTEALLLDPVYSGKAAAGLIVLIQRGELGPDQRVLFLHTGGAPALFAYGTDVIAD